MFYLSDSVKYESLNVLTNNVQWTDIISVNEFDEKDILLAIKKIKANICSGLDNIPGFLIRDCVYPLVEPLNRIYNKCLLIGTYQHGFMSNRSTATNLTNVKYILRITN